MARPEYPTSIRLTTIDKRRLRKYANASKRSLAGLIQMILLDWLHKEENPLRPVEAQEKQQDVIRAPEPVQATEDL